MAKLHRELVGLSFLSTIALAPLAANAADLYRNSPPPSAYVPPAAYVDQNIWSGFYVGLNGGYGWGNGDNTIGYNGSGGDTSARAQPQGGFGGGQIGYNFQSGPVVYGVETDFQGGDLSDRVSGTTAFGNSFTSKENIDWFGTARGRLGYAFGHVLVYGTGGLAYGNVRESAGYAGDWLGNNSTQVGWVAGGGIEYKISPAWSVKGEYQYIDLGSEKLTDAANAVTTNSLDTSFQTVRFGVNYRFGGAAEPLK